MSLALRPKHFIAEWVILCGSLLALGGFISFSLFSEHRNIDTGERARLTAQARVIHDGVARHLQATNHVLMNMAGELPDWRDKDTPLLNLRLKAFADAMPGVRTLVILDESGVARAASRPELIGNNFSRREYFQIAYNSPDREMLFLSPPFKTALGIWSITAVRAIPGPGGKFAGIVAATLDPEEFELLLASALYAPDMWAAIAHGDGKQFMLIPKRAAQEGKNLARPGSFFTRHMDSGRGTSVLTGITYATGEERMMALSTIRPPQLKMNAPLVVAVGRDRAALFAEWRAGAARQGALYGLLTLIAASGLLIHQRRRVAADRLADAQERALRVSADRLNEAQRMAHVGNWSRDTHSGQLQLSDELFHLFEIDPAQFDPASARLLDAVHPEDRDAVERATADSLAARAPYEITHRLLMRDGRVKWVQQRGTAEFDAAGQPLRSIGTVQDITRSVLDQQALMESEERLRIIADYTYDWEYWQGVRGELLYMSPSCERATGYTREEFIADPGLLHNIILPQDRHLMAAHLQDIGHEDDGTLDFRIARKDGETRWIAHGCRSVYWRDGRFMGRRASNRDITERKQAEEQVRQLAYYDMLTGLPNRRLLLDRLQLALTQARRHARAMAVLFLDLDHFKKINDSHGHDVGDALLKQVAGRLRACVRDGDTVARQGGDEFIIVLGEIDRPEAAALVADKIIGAIGAPIHIGDQVLAIMTSIGIAVYPADADEAAGLMKKADQAMYAAKAAGRNNYRFFGIPPSPKEGNERDAQAKT